MTTSLQQLDLMHTPMRGRHLIEASAGTGKTYTLTGLVLRQLLGHGAPQALPIEKILVVTFTNAATEELKDRIRSKIQAAYQGFIGCQVDDPIIQALIDATPETQKPQAILNLDLALRTMDEAAIYTIHSFCHQLLSELAFESGQLFEFEYELDDEALKQDATKDVWRRMCYGLPPMIAEIIYNRFKKPLDLYTYLQPVLHREVSIQPKVPSLEVCTTRYLESISAFHTKWCQHQETQLECLLQLDLNGNTYGTLPNNRDRLRKVWQHITTLCEQKRPIDTEMFSQLFYSQLKLKAKSIKPEPEALGLLVALEEMHDARYSKQLEIAFIQAAKQAIEEDLKRLKLQKNCLSSDDLLSELHRALQNPAQAAILKKSIAELYPVAMIDEFQDTDPIQYAIFSAIYPIHHQQENDQQALYMIGDPKQAIYAFRGADIFTYIKAKRQVTSHFNLTTNYRSSHTMIEGVNQLFAHTPKPFLYHDEIPFHPVYSRGLEEKPPLHIPQTEAMNYRVFSKTFSNKEDASRHLADDCANRIAGILQNAQKGQAKLQEHPVQAKDIAILVRNSHQANFIKSALREHGINSVFLSRDCVFHTELAHDIKFIMKAMMYPRQETFIRSALATRTLGLTLKDIEQFNQKEEQRLFWLEKFFGYQHTWKKINWLTAFTDLMQDCQVTLKMLAQGQDGMRALTDVRHLGDIIQEHNQKLSGQTALLHWYQQQLYNTQVSEEQQLRLESEHDLIQITTIHKSKGLEYNLCFLPFVSLDEDNTQKDSKAQVHHTIDEHQATWHTQSKKCGKAKVDSDAQRSNVQAALAQESLAESIRILYVAVTRAKYLCEISIVQIIKGKSTKQKKSMLHDNALGYLLGFNGQVDLHMTDIQQRLEERATTQAHFGKVHWVDCDDMPMVQYHGMRQPAEKVSQIKVMRHKVNSPWRLGSYSALTYNMQQETSHSALPKDSSIVEDNIRFQFFKGAAAGNFLHELFEHIDFRAYQQEALHEPLSHAIQKHHIEEHWHEPLIHWVAEVLQTPLQSGLRLCDLAPQQVSVEMEFHLPVTLLTTHKIHKLLEDYGYSATPTLKFDDLQGMLKGFIDLWFKHDGKFYIADYKSNYLGGQASDYTSSALKEAITSHRYDVQYLIYTVAIHRYLRQRIPHYDYETHFGGCFYLFLRGMFPDKTHGIFFDRPQFEFIEALDACFTPGVLS